MVSNMAHSQTSKRRSLLAPTVLGLSLTLTACSAGAADDPSETPVVLTTFTVLQDMTAAVGGERVEVRSITPLGAEVHEYDPVPSDVRDAATASLMLANGLGLEEWFEQFTQHSDAPTVTLTEGVDTLPVTRLPGHPETADTADMPVNPHAWISPVRALTYVDNIEEALSELSPEDAEYFTENAEQYRQQLLELDERLRTRIEEFDGEIHLVTCEGAFSYLAEDYGLGEHYLWPLNAEDEGTPAQVEAQIRYISENQVPTVFCESTVNDSAQSSAASAAGAALGDPLYVDSLSEGDGPVPSYLEMLEYDIELILNGAEARFSD